MYLVVTLRFYFLVSGKFLRNEEHFGNYIAKHFDWKNILYLAKWMKLKKNIT